MEKISLKKVFEALQNRLEPGDFEKLTVQTKEFDRGVSLALDGKRYISNVSFWPSGMCEVYSIEIRTEKPIFRHFQFDSNEEASKILTRELKLLISSDTEVQT